MCTDEINNHMLPVILLTSVSYKFTFPVLRFLANFTFHSMYSDFETNNIVFFGKIELKYVTLHKHYHHSVAAKMVDQLISQLLHHNTLLLLVFSFYRQAGKV